MANYNVDNAFDLRGPEACIGRVAKIRAKSLRIERCIVVRELHEVGRREAVPGQHSCLDPLPSAYMRTVFVSTG